MGALVPFKFEGANVRVVEIGGEPWFVGKDVAEQLGYANPSDAIKQHCRGVAKRYPIVDSLGRTQEARVLSEPDVLRLIVSSKLPAAERFERWVFEEVLPTIRKTGGYGVAQSVIRRPASTPARAREVRLLMAQNLKIAAMAGLRGNERILAAGRSTNALTGFDPVAAMGIVLIAPEQEKLLNASDIGEKLGRTAREVNQLLTESGLQKPNRDAKNRLYYEPTAEGIAAGGQMVEVDRSNKTGTARQLRWASRILQVLKAS